MTAGHLYTIPGGGASPPADGEPAFQTELIFGFAGQLAVIPDGNVVMAESHDDFILMLPVSPGTFFDQGMTPGQSTSSPETAALSGTAETAARPPRKG